MPALHPRALRNPLVACVDEFFEILVRQDTGRRVVPDAGDCGAVVFQSLTLRLCFGRLALLFDRFTPVVITAVRACVVWTARLLAMRTRRNRHFAQLPRATPGANVRL